MTSEEKIEAIIIPLKPLMVNKVTATEAQKRRLKQIHWDNFKEAPRDSIWQQPLPDMEFDMDQVAKLFEVRIQPEVHLPIRAGR